jgi:hypothetical protein
MATVRGTRRYILERQHMLLRKDHVIAWLARLQQGDCLSLLITHRFPPFQVLPLRSLALTTIIIYSLLHYTCHRDAFTCHVLEIVLKMRCIRGPYTSTCLSTEC